MRVEGNSLVIDEQDNLALVTLATADLTAIETVRIEKGVFESLFYNLEQESLEKNAQALELALGRCAGKKIHIDLSTAYSPHLKKKYASRFVFYAVLANLNALESVSFSLGVNPLPLLVYMDLLLPSEFRPKIEEYELSQDFKAVVDFFHVHAANPLVRNLKSEIDRLFYDWVIEQGQVLLPEQLHDSSRVNKAEQIYLALVDLQRTSPLSPDVIATALTDKQTSLYQALNIKRNYEDVVVNAVKKFIGLFHQAATLTKLQGIATRGQALKHEIKTYGQLNSPVTPLEFGDLLKGYDRDCIILGSQVFFGRVFEDQYPDEWAREAINAQIKNIPEGITKIAINISALRITKPEIMCQLVAACIANETKFKTMNFGFAQTPLLALNLLPLEKLNEELSKKLCLTQNAELARVVKFFNENNENRTVKAIQLNLRRLYSRGAEKKCERIYKSLSATLEGVEAESALEHVKDAIANPNSALYKSLNSHRTSFVPGQGRFFKATTLKAVRDAELAASQSIFPQ